jgi:hypothetical protein
MSTTSEESAWYYNNKDHSGATPVRYGVIGVPKLCASRHHFTDEKEDVFVQFSYQRELIKTLAFRAAVRYKWITFGYVCWLREVSAAAEPA